MEQDNFDNLLHLEDGFYNEGYRLGVEDGSRAGRIEGRAFGLQKGFEKYVELGQILGNVELWQARVHGRKAHVGEKPQEMAKETLVPPLPSNPRLQKHLQTLYALLEPETLSTENNGEVVADIEDRLKHATAKAKIVEKIVGEGNSGQMDSKATEAKVSDREHDIDASERLQSQVAAKVDF